MKSFIADLVDTLIAEDIDFEKTCFVFPSKRAGRFMIHYLKERSAKTQFAPQIFSIEEFVEQVSGLNKVDQIEAVFRLYTTYKSLTPSEDQEDFDTFYQWSQTIIYDFNEIDRYLIPAHSFFDYLSDIQDLNHWSKHEEKTPLVENYLKFWKMLPNYYEHFTQALISDGFGHQGLQYRQASELISTYLGNTTSTFVFAGFNALNTAEQRIIQTVLETGKGRIFWDTDKVFFEDKQHGASYFLRNYQKQWAYFQEKTSPFEWIGEHYHRPKDIEIIGVPKNVGQVKYIGEILSKLPEKELQNAAIVLGDERLAIPMLNSLPEQIGPVNVTMGLPLSQTSLASFFDLLLELHQGKPKKFYYKHVLSLINHPSLGPVIGDAAAQIVSTLTKNNLTFLTGEEIIRLTNSKSAKIVALCFMDYADAPLHFTKHMLELTQAMRIDSSALHNETLFHFHHLFLQLHTFLEKGSPVQTLHSLFQLYKNHIQTESLDFSGAPFSGLQMMGMLETRGLDFETVILASVNEGILPSGKSTNSYIPHDLKQAYGLPTYKEKDAVYAYHFYRLLQRAKKVYLLYNSIPDELNKGEKSRFITQLQIEKQPQHTLTEFTVAPKVPALQKKLTCIEKTPAIIARLQEIGASGFSPSSLLTYVRNPVDFYHRYVLRVKETQEVEETLAANTLGTIIHRCLESLYTSPTGKAYSLTKELLSAMQKTYKQSLSTHFADEYENTEALKTGKNVLAFEVSKNYIKRFLEQESTLLEKHQIEIVALEKALKRRIDLPELNFPIHLKGSADRIDRLDGKLRIIDYKTGHVTQGEVEIVEWDMIAQDYKHSKAFQVLAYAYMNHTGQQEDACEAGIISFKNLKSGFLKFGAKTAARGGNKDQSITEETLDLFEQQLKALIVEIFDPSIPFVEKIIEKKKG